MKTLVLTVVGITVAMFATASSLQAQQVVNNVTIAATALAENAHTQTVTEFIVPAPLKLSITNKSLLNAIAIRRGTLFPAGSKIVALQTWGSAPTYLVVDKSNVLLSNISDIMTSGRVGSPLIHQGAYFLATQLAAPAQTNTEYYTFAYNDATTAFNLQGQMVHSRNDSKVNAVTGLFTESQNNVCAPMAGNGSSAGAGIVVTGSVKFAGAGKFVF